MTTQNRSAFVLQDFRYTTAENAVVQTRYPKARTVTIDTQLDEANAQALAAKVLAANTDPVVYELQVQGLMLPDAFKGGVPTYKPDFPKFRTDGREMKVVSFSCDLETGISTIRVRG